MSGIGADLLEDCSKHVDRQWQKHGRRGLVCCVAGNRTSAVDAERSQQRESTSDSSWINSHRYCGDAPFRQWCTRIVDAFKHTQPVQFHKHWCHMVELAHLKNLFADVLKLHNQICITT